jgi:glycosyltransferase involved in cell wall biosynthesis
VWQRPQHLLSRLARQHRVLFVEEPITLTDEGEGKPRLEVFPGHSASNVTVLRLLLPASQPCQIGHGDPQTQEIYTRLLLEYLKNEGYTNPILWMYTPMGLDFVEAIQPELLVYDVMDQLSAFLGAPPQLLQREETLLRRADLVFTGGMSLYRAKLPFNPNTHLFPSGVEIEHFAQATKPGAFERPADLQNIPRPVLGYYGVIDERMDLPLLAHLAQSHPEWQIVMLGPVVKINPKDLPQAPNLHYPGIKSYEELPAYLNHFDVALVPFAMNEATRYLSPTKTLEYMAAHKPVVSTPIHDVIELYGEVVRVASTPAEFVSQVEAALKEDAKARLPKEDELLAQHTWNSIADRMDELIKTQLERPSQSEFTGNVVDKQGRVQVQA